MLSLFLPECELCELLYADDLVLLSEIIEGLRDKFSKLKVFERKGLKDNLGKIKLMFSSGTLQDGMSKIKVDPCGVCSLQVKANSVLCVQCGPTVNVPGLKG